MFTPLRMVIFSLFSCEALGLAGLYLSAEMGKSLLLALFVLSAVLLYFRFRLSDKLLLWFLASTIFVSGILPFVARLNISAVLPIGAVLMHLFLFCSERTIRNYYWRLGFSFMEMVLASIIAPEAYMFFFIFAFVLNCSLVLSFLFLMQNFQKYEPSESARPLPTNFLRYISILSALIFLSAFVIFPILPRSNWTGLGSSTKADIGYVEQINYQNSLLGWTQSNAKIVMQIYLPSEMKLSSPIFPLGLLRGKPLSNFRGSAWLASSEPMYQGDAEEEFDSSKRIEVQREEISSGLLPIPYGATAVTATGYKNLRPQISGEWIYRTSANKPIRYSFQISSKNNFYFEEDKPRASHLKIPMANRFKRLNALGLQLKKGTQSDLERIKRIENYFDRAGFRADLEPLNSISETDTHPIEEFLFEKKVGHCELFAASGALLARAMGMPSRVVVGFRFDPKIKNQVIVVRNTDAHAWAEIWTKEKGWVPIDLTPFTAYSPRWYENASFLYDWVSLYWNRNILGYEISLASIKALLPEVKDFAGLKGIILLALIFTFLFRRKLYRFLKSKTIREKMSSHYLRALHRAGGELPKSVKDEYYPLRFGRKEPNADDLKRFLKILKGALKAASAK